MATHVKPTGLPSLYTPYLAHRIYELIATTNRFPHGYTVLRPLRLASPTHLSYGRDA